MDSYGEFKDFCQTKQMSVPGSSEEVDFWYFDLGHLLHGLVELTLNRFLSEYKFIAHNIDALFMIWLLTIQLLIIVFGCVSAIDYW